MFKSVISVASFCLLCSIVPLYQCLCLMYLSLYCFCSHFLIVNRMCAWLSFHALPHALATHLHPCSSPTPAGLLLVRSSCLVALLLQLSTHTYTLAIFHLCVCLIWHQIKIWKALLSSYITCRFLSFLLRFLARSLSTS